MNKKYLVFAVFSLCALIGFSCTLPTAIEVKMHPDISVAASKNIGDIFSMDELTNNLTGIDIFDCTEVKKTQTFLLYLNITPTPIPLGTYILSLPGGITLTDGVTVPPSSIAQGTTSAIDLDGLNNYLDEFLSGFDCYSIQGEVIISGNNDAAKELVPLFNIKDFSVNSGSTLITNQHVTSPSTPVSDELTGNNTTSLLSLPGKGASFDATLLFNGNGNLEFNYEIELPTFTLNQEMATALSNTSPTVTIEILIWLPLQFKAGTSGGILKIPDLFDDNKTDIFGRSAGGDNEMIESLRNINFSMTLDNHLFQNNMARISIKEANSSTTLTSSRRLQGNELVMALNNQDMDTINKTIPFKPEVRLLFDKDAILTIPRDLTITKIGFNAEIVYREKL